MRVFLILASIALVIVLATASSRSDTETDTETPPADDTTEPITGQPVTPNPGSEQPMRDPFSMYDPGPPEALWRYEDLTSEEKATADRGRTQDYQLAARAKAEAAAIELGTENLDSMGVQP